MTARPPHYRRNYVALCLDGALYMGAVEFVGANTVLPAMVVALGGKPWLVSLMPVLMWMGAMGTPLFTAHRIERLHTYKAWVALAGILMRLPYLVAGIVLLGWPETPARIALWLVASAPLVMGLSCGLTMTAWQQLFARAIPVERRASLLAIRYASASLIGLCAGYVVRHTLQLHSGLSGYGRLFLYSSVLLWISYIAFLSFRETVVMGQLPAPRVNLLHNLRSAPALFVRPDTRRFVLAMLLANGLFVTAPFLALHACRVLDRPASFVGVLLSVQMAGALAGNLFAGWAGDRWSAKVVVLASQATTFAVGIVAALAKTQPVFLLAFLGTGFAVFARHVGTHTLTLELCPQERRATFLAVVGFSQLLSLLGASALATFAWQSPSGLTLNSLITSGIAAVSFALFATIQEPRGADKRSRRVAAPTTLR